MLKEPLLNNLSFDELLEEAHRKNGDPLFQAIHRRWHEDADGYEETINDLGQEVDSLRDDRDDIEYSLDRKMAYIHRCHDLVEHIIKKGYWEFVSTEEKTSDEIFAFEDKFKFCYNGFDFEKSFSSSSYEFDASLLVLHGDVTRVEIRFNNIFNMTVMDYDLPVTNEQAMSDAKMHLIQLIYDRVEHE